MSVHPSHERYLVQRCYTRLPTAGLNYFKNCSYTVTYLWNLSPPRKLRDQYFMFCSFTSYIDSWHRCCTKWTRHVNNVSWLWTMNRQGCQTMPSCSVMKHSPWTEENHEASQFRLSDARTGFDPSISNTQSTTPASTPHFVYLSITVIYMSFCLHEGIRLILRKYYVRDLLLRPVEKTVI
jgi:hypothetical protein